MDWTNNNVFEDIRNWWVSLTLGIVFILVAMCLLFAPILSLVTIGAIFSIAIFISGIMELIFAIGNRRALPSWGWYIAGGIIDIIIGAYLIAYPYLSDEMIPYLIAFWLLFRGFTLCGYSTDIRYYKVHAWGWYLAFGLLAIICSLILLWHPVLTSMFPVFMLAFTLFIMGVFRILFSIELHYLHKKELKEH